MLDYKHRKIELTPRRSDDGAWACPYRIIEFRAMCWGWYEGTPRGVFASRDAAAAAALDEAKRVVDTLEPPAQDSWPKPSLVLATYGKKLLRLLARPRR